MSNHHDQDYRLNERKAELAAQPARGFFDRILAFIRWAFWIQWKIYLGLVALLAVSFLIPGIMQAFFKYDTLSGLIGQLFYVFIVVGLGALFLILKYRLGALISGVEFLAGDGGLWNLTDVLDRGGKQKNKTTAPPTARGGLMAAREKRAAGEPVDLDFLFGNNDDPAQNRPEMPPRPERGTGKPTRNAGSVPPPPPPAPDWRKAALRKRASRSSS